MTTRGSSYDAGYAGSSGYQKAPPMTPTSQQSQRSQSLSQRSQHSNAANSCDALSTRSGRSTSNSSTATGKSDESWRKPGKHFRSRLLLKDKNAFPLNKDLKIEKYYQVADRVLDQFLQHPIDTRDDLIEAYLIGSRLANFLSQMLPTHPTYFASQHNLTLLRDDSQRKMVELVSYIEQIATLIDRQEHQLYISRVIGNGWSSVNGGSGEAPAGANAMEILMDTTRAPSAAPGRNANGDHDHEDDGESPYQQQQEQQLNSSFQSGGTDPSLASDSSHRPLLHGVTAARRSNRTSGPPSKGRPPRPSPPRPQRTQQQHQPSSPPRREDDNDWNDGHDDVDVVDDYDGVDDDHAGPGAESSHLQRLPTADEWDSAWVQSQNAEGSMNGKKASSPSDSDWQPPDSMVFSQFSEEEDVVDQDHDRSSEDEEDEDRYHDSDNPYIHSMRAASLMDQESQATTVQEDQDLDLDQEDVDHHDPSSGRGLGNADPYAFGPLGAHDAGSSRGSPSSSRYSGSRRSYATPIAVQQQQHHHQGGDYPAAPAPHPEERRSSPQQQHQQQRHHQRSSPGGSSSRTPRQQQVLQRQQQEEDPAWQSVSFGSHTRQGGGGPTPFAFDESLQLQSMASTSPRHRSSPESRSGYRLEDDDSEGLEPSHYQPDLGQHGGRESPALGAFDVEDIVGDGQASTCSSGDSHGELLADVLASFEQQVSPTRILNVTPQFPNLSREEHPPSAATGGEDYNNSSSGNRRRSSRKTHQFQQPPLYPSALSSRRQVPPNPPTRGVVSPTAAEEGSVAAQSNNDETILSNTELNEQVEQIIQRESMTVSPHLLSFERELGEDNSAILTQASSSDEDDDSEGGDEADDEEEEPYGFDERRAFAGEEKKDCAGDVDEFDADFSHHGQHDPIAQPFHFDPFSSGFDCHDEAAAGALDSDPTLFDAEYHRQEEQQQQRTRGAVIGAEPAAARHIMPKLEPSKRDLLARQQQHPRKPVSPASLVRHAPFGRTRSGREQPVDLDDTVDCSFDDVGSTIVAIGPMTRRDPPTKAEAETIMTSLIEERWAAASHSNKSSKASTSSPSGVHDVWNQSHGGDDHIKQGQGDDDDEHRKKQLAEYEEELDIEMINAFLTKNKRRPALSHLRGCVRCLLD